MKALRIQTGACLEPFQDPIAKALVAGRRLEIGVNEAFASCGMVVEDVLPERVGNNSACLLLADTLFLTRACLGRFLEASRTVKGIARLAMPHDALQAYLGPLQNHDPDRAISVELYLCPANTLPKDLDWPGLKAWLDQHATEVPVDPKPQVEALWETRPRTPFVLGALPRTLVLATPVLHWVHLLRLNHLMPWVRLQEHWQDRSSLVRSWRSRGSNPARRGQRLSVIGKNCDIHPTAWVENSLLGDGVRLGPHTSVRDSILMNDVEISDHTKLKRCVVGTRCHTLNDSYFVGCTFYPRSTMASFLLRNTVLGRRVFITSGVMFWDEGIEDTVRVRIDGQEVDTGLWQLGGCAGHECVLGTRAIFLPGREVQNGTMIVMRPEEGVSKLPTQVEAGDPHICHDGRIVPLAQALPDWKPLEIDPDHPIPPGRAT